MDETLKTIYKGDYLWPYIIPLQYKPKKPPDGFNDEKEKNLLDKELCICSNHSWSPHFERARYLKEKEKSFREAMLSLAQQRTILENEIFDHPCTDSEDVLASLYKLQFAKKEFPLTEYREMIADHDDPVVTPVAMPRDPLKSSYRDTTIFRKVAIVRPAIRSPLPITFVPDTSDRENFQVPLTEYEEQINKSAKANSLALQMFQETEYSSRK